MAAENDDPAADGPRCPKCKHVMDFGQVCLRINLSLLYTGVSDIHGYFVQDGDRKQEMKVIDNAESNPAYHCKPCGIVIFQYKNKVEIPSIRFGL